jgi:hypothetical protein
LWAYFEDVELVGMANPQGDITTSRKKRSNTAVEQEDKGVGPIQSLAMNVSKAAGFLNPVPILGEFSRPVGWAADIVSNVASVFGWSAPINLVTPHRVIRNTAIYANNVNKVDSSLPLSLYTDNEVVVHPSFAFDKADEMDIVKFVMRPAFVREFSWASTDAAGTALTEFGVRPNEIINTRLVDSLLTSDYAPCQYMSTLFSAWRGSMVYTFKFVKTEFHSGRIAIAFYLEERASTPATPGRSLDESDYVYREVIDVREHNEVTICVPYISTSPYRPVESTSQGPGKIGTISVYVLDPLIAPNTVSNTVDILMEMSMGPDAEFFYPKMLHRNMNMAATLQSENLTPDRSDCSLKSGPIGGVDCPTYQLNTSQICVGERLTSLRSLLKRFDTIATVGVTANSYTTVVPFGFPTTNLAAPVDNDALLDFYGQMASMFCYSRGGVRLKIKMDLGLDASGIALLVDNIDQLGPTKVVDSSANVGGVFYSADHAGTYNYVIQDQFEEKFIEVQVPMYNRYASRPNASQSLVHDWTTENIDASMRTRTMVVAYNYRPTGALTSFTPIVLRAGADDCNFGGFISIPPMI